MLHLSKSTEQFEAAGLPVYVVENPDADAYVKDNLGYLSAPVVVVSEHDHWTGLRPDHIERVIAVGGANNETPRD